MTSVRRSKDAGESLEYAVNFDAVMGAGVTISTCTWAASPTGLTVGASSIDGSVVTVRLSGGTTGTLYQVKATATLSNTDVVVRYIEILCEDRPAT